jgi:hypothetical protein
LIASSYLHKQAVELFFEESLHVDCSGFDTIEAALADFNEAFPTNKS